MTLFIAIAWLTLVLTGVSVVVSGFILTAHYLENRREARREIVRGQLRRRVVDYIEGRMSFGDALVVLHEERDLALGVLLGVGAGRPATEGSKLFPLYEELGLVADQLAELKHRGWTRRTQAATRLGFMGSPVPIPALVAALEDDMLDVRLSAAYALARLQATQAVAPILLHLALPAYWPLQRMTEILTRMGRSAIDPIISFLHDPKAPAPARAACIRALGALGAHEATRLIIETLAHGDKEVRVQSARALGQLGAEEALPVLMRAMSDDDWEVRAVAASALGRLGDEAAVPVLTRGLCDLVFWVRFNSADALYHVGPHGRLALEEADSAEDAFAKAISRQVLDEHRLPPAEHGGLP